MIEDDLAYLDGLAREAAEKLTDSPSVKATLVVFTSQVEVARKILVTARDRTTAEDQRERLIASVVNQRNRLARFLLEAHIRPLRKLIGRDERRRLEGMLDA